MDRGRPKAEIPRAKRLDLRLTNYEFEKIARISKQLNITKTEAILRGIDLLITTKPKRYKTITNVPKASSMNISEEVRMYDTKK